MAEAITQKHPIAEKKLRLLSGSGKVFDNLWRDELQRRVPQRYLLPEHW